MNREVELLKVKVLADYFHNMFRFASSVQVSGFIGLYVGIVLLLVQERMTNVDAVMALALLSGMFIVVFLLLPLRGYHASLSKIDDLLNLVEKGESLPSLKKLRKL